MDADLTRIRQLNEIGIALSAERDHAMLLGRILSSARALTDPNAGTLYTMDPAADRLDFAIVQNDTLGIHLGGSGTPVGDGFPSVVLYQPDGTANDQHVAAYAVLNDATVNIEDAYDAPGVDFSGTRRFDEATGYRSRALLTVPMHDHEGEIVAVLQLLNKQTASGVEAFTEADRHTAEPLASQAAVAITNQRLIDGMQALFDSYTRVIARAIDAKSAHTGAHCRRVPAATLVLAEAADRSDHPLLADFSLTDDDRCELSTAAWLHACGKVVTPHNVMEKSTKLEGLFDRLALIETRFAVRRQAIEQSATGDRDAQCQQLAEDLDRVRQANRGDIPLTDEAVAELERIAALTFAGGHNERMDGTGYPKGLTREELSLPARMMGITHVFEALTAPDRPYKAPMKLSQALTIMGWMVEDNHLDPDLFRVFVDEGIYPEYAKAHLD